MDPIADLDPALLQSKDPEDWLRLVATSVTAQHWEEAEKYFQIVYAKLNDYSKNTTAQDLGFMPGHSSAHVLHRFADVCADSGAPERSLPKLRDLAHLLAGFRNSDDYYLVARGMVTLDAFCATVEKVYPSTSTDPIWRDLFKELQSKLDDDGRSRIYELRQSLS